MKLSHVLKGVYFTKTMKKRARHWGWGEIIQAVSIEKALILVYVAPSYKSSSKDSIYFSGIVLKLYPPYTVKYCSCTSFDHLRGSNQEIGSPDRVGRTFRRTYEN